MSKRMMNLITLCIMVGSIASISSPAEANWLETFGGNALDNTWTWGCYPDVTKTFSHPIKDGPGDDDYLGLEESTASDQFGSQFGMGFGAGDFADVRVGAVVNVTGDASRNYSGIAARAGSFVDPDGSITGIAPGMVVTGAYTLFYHWEDGPLRVRIELMKVYMNGNDIHEGSGTFMPEVPVPGLDHARDHYVELEVVGSDPVYVTGSIYAYKGGPLLVRTPTMIDTSGQDPWENPTIPTPPGMPPAIAVLTGGKSGVFAVNENPSPVGYHVTFDTVSSVSEPAAVCLSPADGSADIDIDTDLSWVEADFATSRELWFGKSGAMRKVSPAGTTYDPGTLELGQTYQWRVDQIGAGGTVEGHLWSFTTEGTSEGCLMIDDFESYNSHVEIQAPDAWPDDIGMTQYKYTFLETFEVYAGAKTMRFEYQNQYEPYITRAVHTFAEPEDWTKGGLAVFSLHFRGDDGNIEQPFSIELEDNLGHSYGVANPYSFAPLTELWQKWSIELSEFGDNGVDLTAVKKISIRTGSGTNTGQPLEAIDVLYIDDVKVCPLKCSLNSNADLDGNCRIDFVDFSAIANEWLNEGGYQQP